jgi:hypothetical protein
MSTPAPHGFREIFVHVSDGEECWDPEIMSTLNPDGTSGPATCNIHEEACVSLLEYEKTHANTRSK